MITMPEQDYTQGQLALIEIARHVIEHSRSIICEDKEDLSAFAHCIVMPNDGGDRPDHAVLAIHDLFTPAASSMRPAILKSLFAQMQAVAYIIASEAWTLPEEVLAQMVEDGDLSHGPLHDDPRRVSTLLVQGENIEGDYFHAAFEIDEDNGRAIDFSKPRNLVCFNEHDGTTRRITGAMSNLLPRLNRASPYQVH